MVEMKESGIAWVGDIPFDWEVQKGKYCLKYIEKPVKEDDDVITCFRDGEVTLRKNRREDGFTISEKEIGYQGIDVGDLIVHGMDGFAGAIGISDSRGKASPVLNVLDTTHNKKFIMYYLRNMAYNGVFIALATGIRVRTCDTNWGKLKELPYILPPRQIQDRIVQCIDNRCAEIDAISSEIQEQINTLEEYKKSVITDAVTKGLNPNAEMKDSGIEWIGQVPKDWTSTRLGVSSWVRARLGWKGLRAEEYVDEGHPFLSAFNIVNNKVSWESLNYINDERYDESPEIKLSIGDIIIVKDGAGIGKCARINSLPLGTATTNSSLGVITTRNRLSNLYLYYYLQCAVFQNLIFRMINGMGVPHLTQETLRKIVIPLPSLDEQRQITEYLDSKCAEIDGAIEDKQKQLETLEDYKKTLIYEYVTGKKEVA